jgi:hypothetical protein
VQQVGGGHAEVGEQLLVVADQVAGGVHAQHGQFRAELLLGGHHRQSAGGGCGAVVGQGELGGDRGGLVLAVQLGDLQQQVAAVAAARQ